MFGNLLFVIMSAAVIAAAVFAWWFEHHDGKTDSEKEIEGKEKQ